MDAARIRGDAAKAKEATDTLEGWEEEDVSEIPDDFFVASKGGVLPIEMAEICNLLKWRTRPHAFCEQIANNDALGNADKLRTKHIS